MAALRLADILIQQGRQNESKEYLCYVLSQEPDNKEALEMLDELKDKKGGN
jgi:hypothetical protein